MAGLILGYVSLGATAVIGVVLLFFLIVGTAAAIPAPNCVIGAVLLFFLVVEVGDRLSMVLRSG